MYKTKFTCSYISVFNKHVFFYVHVKPTKPEVNEDKLQPNCILEQTGIVGDCGEKVSPLSFNVTYLLTFINFRADYGSQYNYLWKITHTAQLRYLAP